MEALASADRRFEEPHGREPGGVDVEPVRRRPPMRIRRSLGPERKPFWGRVREFDWGD